MKLKTLLIPDILLDSGAGLSCWVSADAPQASDSVAAWSCRDHSGNTLWDAELNRLLGTLLNRG